MGGMSTSYSGSYDWDSTPTVTRKSARDYAQTDKREFTGDTSTGINPPVGKDISTDSPLAAILVVDVTGSMNEWPGMIFQKIPTLYHESNATLQGLSADDVKTSKKSIEDILEMAVIAVGDARGDKHPIQVVDFAKGTDLVKGVNKIFPEGGGGGNAKESYDLAAYYILNHCKTPKVAKGAKPIVIFAGDEGFYDMVKTDEAKRYFGDTLKSNLDTSTMMKELTKKYDVFMLRPEPGSYDQSTYNAIHKQWQSVLGSERVLKMENPGRLVDCVIGICGYASDNFDKSVDLLKRRQTPEQVREVLETLHSLHPTK